MMACENGHKEVVSMLLLAGAQVHLQDKSVSMVTISKGRIEGHIWNAVWMQIWSEIEKHDCAYKPIVLFRVASIDRRLISYFIKLKLQSVLNDDRKRTLNDEYGRGNESVY